MGIATTPEERFNRLFADYHRLVYAYCRRRTDAETAGDCAAEAFSVAWRKLDEVPDGPAAIGWLYGVARKVLANEFRSSRRRRNLLRRMRAARTVPNPGPDSLVVRREQDQRVADALGQLRPRDQELLRLALWEELPHAEIAAQYGCSTQAATQRIYRATRRAARVYQHLEGHHQHAQAPQQLQGGETG